VNIPFNGAITKVINKIDGLGSIKGMGRDLMYAGRMAHGEVMGAIRGVQDIGLDRWKTIGMSAARRAGIGAAWGAGVGASYSALSGDGSMGRDTIRGAMLGAIGYGGYTGGRSVYNEARYNQFLRNRSGFNTSRYL
jgi:hypothetical protein